MRKQDASSKAAWESRRSGPGPAGYAPSEGEPGDRFDQDKAFQDMDMTMGEESGLLDLNEDTSRDGYRQRRTLDARPTSCPFPGRMEGGADDASVNSLESGQKIEGAKARNAQKNAPNQAPGAEDLRKPLDGKDASKFLDMDSQFGFSVMNDEDPQLQLLQGNEQDLPTQESELDYFEAFLQSERREFVIFGSQETAKTYFSNRI